jgi:hypothetical protein
MDKTKLLFLKVWVLCGCYVAIAKADGTIETVEAKKYNYCNGIEAC